MKHRAPVIFGAVALASLVAACQTYEPPPYDGRNLYLGYCAACHGPEGAGDGPVAANLNVLVPDLRILKGADGAFPRALVEEVVDGRTLRAGHGTQEMPVWGFAFRRDEGDTPEGVANVQARVEALADYVESLQR
jgi:mono/diheme cytochrome c family protein